MLKNNIVILLIYFILCTNLVCYGDTTQIPVNNEINKQATLVIAENDNLLENCLYLNEIDDFIILELLTKLLKTPGFLLINNNWWLFKIFLMLIIPLSASVNNLGITTHDNITIGLLLVTQFTIPLNILNAFILLDRLKTVYDQGIKNTIKVCKQNIPKTIYYLTNIAISIYLSYLSSLIDTQTSGHAYAWIFSKFTNSKKTLKSAYHLGYILNLMCVLALSSVFFFNLINEIFHQTGIGYLLKLSPSLKYNVKELSYYQHVNNLRKIIHYSDTETAIKRSKDYLVNNNLNTTIDIANLQLHCSEKSYHEKSVANIYINLVKFGFIVTMAVFCAEAFRQIFSSKLLLQDFIEDYANITSNNYYSFLLNNNQVFTCDTIDHCINNIDINAINISKKEINHLLSLNQDGILANSLKGIAVSTNTAAMLIMFANYAWKIKNKKLFRDVIFTSYYDKKNIIPVIVATSLLVSGYYYMQNIYNVSTIAEKSNDLLSRSSDKIFLPVTASVILAISSTGFTCSRGVCFLVNITNYSIYLINKLKKYCCGK